MQRGAMMCSIAACVAIHPARPNASPKPVMPSSVSTLTSSVCRLRLASPPDIGTAPSNLSGTSISIGSTRVIFILNCCKSFAFNAGILDKFAPFGHVGFDCCRKLFRRTPDSFTAAKKCLLCLRFVERPRNLLAQSAHNGGGRPAWRQDADQTDHFITWQTRSCHGRKIRRQHGGFEAGDRQPPQFPGLKMRRQDAHVYDHHLHFV